jgi:hypothetical protein
MRLVLRNGHALLQSDVDSLTQAQVHKHLKIEDENRGRLGEIQWREHMENR